MLYPFLTSVNTPGNSLSCLLIPAFICKMEIVAVTAFENVSTSLMSKLINFITKHQVGTAHEIHTIFKSVDYALSPYKYQGGFILMAEHDGMVLGALVVNRTNMEGYVPRNLLTYLAINPLNTFKDVDRKLVKKAVELTISDLAFHIPVDSPLIHLFEEVGFEKNYFEMRMKK